jgi:hypothetical protein
VLRELNAVRAELWHLRPLQANRDSDHSEPPEHQSRSRSIEMSSMSEWHCSCEKALRVNAALGVSDFLELMASHTLTLLGHDRCGGHPVNDHDFGCIKVFCPHFQNADVSTLHEVGDVNLARSGESTSFPSDFTSESTNVNSKHIQCSSCWRPLQSTSSTITAYGIAQVARILNEMMSSSELVAMLSDCVTVTPRVGWEHPLSVESCLLRFLEILHGDMSSLGY